MIVALDAAASWMSFLVMPPTPRRTNDSFTSSRSSFRRLSVSASSEPVTSALRMRLSVAASPGLDLLEDVLELGAAAGDRGRRGRGWRRAASARGSRPRCGPSSRRGRRRSRRRRRPRRRGRAPATGVDGPASLTCSPWSSMSARTRPHAAPATSGSPTLQRAALHEHGGHRAPADVEVGLEHHALGPPVGVGPEVLDVGDEQQVLEQVVDAEVLQRRDLRPSRVAAPRLGDEALLGRAAA